MRPPSTRARSAPVVRLTTRGARVLVAMVVLLMALAGLVRPGGPDGSPGPLTGHVAPGVALGMAPVGTRDGLGR